jgi:4-carboxymuconolactone decarboxylase
LEDVVSDLREKGLHVFEELMGEQAAAMMKESLEGDGFGAGMADLATNFAFAGVWGRAGLERKQRSLVTIGILIAQRQTSELKNHIRIGLRNGLTAREIEEALIQSVPYCGFPAAATAMNAVIEVLREQGIDMQTRTPRERGML